MNEKEFFRIASKYIRSIYPTKDKVRKDMCAYAISDYKFVAKYPKKTAEIYSMKTRDYFGIFERGERFGDPKLRDPIGSTCSVVVKYDSEAFSRSARGMIEAVKFKYRGTGLSGMIQFVTQAVIAIGWTPEAEVPCFMDLLVLNQRKTAAKIMADAYRGDLEVGEIRRSCKGDPYSLKESLPSMVSGEYIKEWHNSDGLTIEEFLKQYWLDPHSKKEIIKA